MSDSPHDFSIFYREYYPKIVGYLRRLVGDAEAEDVAQETFVKVSRSLDGFRGESQLSTWIYRIATNAALDHLRRPSDAPSARREHGTGEDDGPDDAPLADDAPLHDALLIRKEMSDCIRGLVNDLPENYRTVMVLADLEELTNAEIGDVLGLTLNTVKIRLHRARLQLKKTMDQACHLYRDARNELSCERKSTRLEFKKME